MTWWLKQSTAVVVPFGPFLLFSDGVTLVTNLVGTGSNQTENTSTGIRLSKNGGAQAARHATATASTYDAFGEYLVTLDTTDTGTLGTLRMTFTNGAAFCPVWMDFMVVPANVWDSMFGASELLVNVDKINSVSTSPVTTIKAVQGLATDGVVPTVTAVTGLTASNLDATITSRMATFTLPTNFSSFVIDSTGRVNSFMIGILTSVFTEGATGRIAAAFKQFFNIASPAATMDHGILTDTTTTLTNAPSDSGGVTTLLSRLTSARAGYLDALNTGVTLASSAVQAIWDALTSALTTTGSIGKLLVTNIDALISSRTKPADTQAAVTLVTTTTNSTNAPTNGDFTAAMKTSLNAATPAVTVSDKTGFSLSSGGNTAAAAALLAAVAEAQGSYTVAQILSIVLSVCAGVTSAGGTVLKTPNGSATRVTATVDGSNNRTAMTLTP